MATLLMFPGRPVLQVTQLDLAEERLLRKKLDEAASAYQAKRLAIRRAIERGCPIEPGLRSATILRRKAMVIR